MKWNHFPLRANEDSDQYLEWMSIVSHFGDGLHFSQSFSPAYYSLQPVILNKPSHFHNRMEQTVVRLGQQKWRYIKRLPYTRAVLSRNFVEVWWRSLFRSTSIGKRCASYNAPPTSRIRAADRWSELNSVFGLEKVDLWNPIRTSAIQSRSRPMRFLGFSNHEKGAQRQEIPK
jgi:hypothetical protein